MQSIPASSVEVEETPISDNNFLSVATANQMNSRRALPPESINT